MPRKQRKITIEGELPMSRHILKYNEIEHMTVSHYLHIHEVEWIAPNLSDQIRIGQAASRIYEECYGESAPTTFVALRQKTRNGDDIYFEREYNAYPDPIIEMAICHIMKAAPC